MPRLRLVTAPGRVPCAVTLPVGATLPRFAAAAAAVEGFSGRAGEACTIFTPDGMRLLLGTGGGSAAELHDAGARVVSRLGRHAHIALDATSLAPEQAVAFATGASLRAWRCHRSPPSAPPSAPTPASTRPDDTPPLSRIDIVTDAAPALRPFLAAATAVLRGVRFARDLVAEPSNSLTPGAFADRLAGLARHGLDVTVLRPDDLKRQHFGGLLAVGRGSMHAPLLAVLRWKGRGEAAPVAFVGKGITFDTGGLCIKSANGMEAMRADMAGAAACAGAMLVLALRRSPTPALAVLPIAENAIGADSYRPGDVVRSQSGRTIEIIDTDAEGRLVLADALSWTVRTQHPRAVIDLATLTGSIVVALGHHMAGLFDNDPALGAAVAAAGAAVGEPVWKLPIGDSLRGGLASDIADLRQCRSGRLLPDACDAAAFLREFTDGTPWAHLDIAGVAVRETADDLHAAGPTGFGVRLLDRLVAMRFENAGH